MGTDSDAQEDFSHKESAIPERIQIAETDYQNAHWSCWRFYMYMVIVGLCLGLYGYDNAFASPLISLPFFIAKYQGPSIAFTARNDDLIITVPLVGAAVGTFISAPLIKKYGRKWIMVGACALLCTPGSFLQLFAPNIGALVVGRAWNYIGISVLTNASPLYLSEIAPAHVRGRAIGFCTAGVTAVSVLASTLVWGTEQINDSRQYQIPLAVQAAAPVLLGLLILLCPESPFWDLQNNRIDRCRQTLLSVRNHNADIVESEILVLKSAIAAHAEDSKNIRFWSILDRVNVKRTLTAGALLSLGQVGGQILILTYATVALVQSGVANPFQVTVIITCLQFLGTVLGPILIDRVGRRPVALVGFCFLFVLDLAAGSLAAAGLQTNSQRLGLTAVFIIFGFINAVSFQSLSYVLPAEIPAPALREATMAWAVFWSNVTAVITTFAVPQLMNADAANLGAKTSFIFAGCVLITILWAYWFLPETRSRTVAEIDELYTLGLPMRKWRHYVFQSERDV